MKQVHALLHRMDNLSLTQAVVVVFTVDDNCDLSPNDLFDQLRDGVTEWARKTSEGRQSYEYAGNDMNIGDLGNADCSRVIVYTPSIHAIDIIRPDIPSEYNYDTSLCEDIEEDAYESSS